MKLLKTNFWEYTSPEAKPVEIALEGLLCTSTFVSNDAQLEGFDKENEFTGWGN